MSLVLAKIGLTGAPVGKYSLTRATPILPSRTRSSRLAATADAAPLLAQGQSVRHRRRRLRTILECLVPRDAAMVTGDEDWADYTVSAKVRLITQYADPDEDHPDVTEARAGLVARYQTSRHYYLFALVSTGKAALYRRAGGDWHILAETPVDLDRRRYYQMALSVQGNRMRATLDGQVTLEVVDDRYVTVCWHSHQWARTL